MNGLNNMGGNRSRYTTQQKEKLEEFFQNCSHPDARQRQQLSEEIGIEPMQIKFWFQNRRTQKKTLGVRDEKEVLKLENEKLRQENLHLHEEEEKRLCATCLSRDERHQSDMLKLRSENMELKQEIERISKIVDRVKGKEFTETPLSEKPIPKIHLWWPSLDLEILGVGILVDASHIMINSFWDSLYTFQEPVFPRVQSEDIQVLVRNGIGSACSTLCLGVSREVLFDFLVDEKSRTKWDFFTDGSVMRKTAEVSFGAHPGIWVSIFQPSSLNESSMSIIQATYNNTLGSVVIYAPVPVQWIRSMRRGEGSNLPTLPVGFIISGSGDVAASTSSSSRIDGGSILTMFFQSSVESDTPITTIITSTMQKIKAALKF